MLTVVLMIASFIGGAVFSYLFLRANGDKKATLDTTVNKFK